MADLNEAWKRTSEHLGNLEKVMHENPPGSELHEYCLQDFKEVLGQWKDLANKLGNPDITEALNRIGETLRRIEAEHSGSA